MNSIDQEMEGLARACRTLGVEAVAFTTLDDLKEVVRTAGRERAGCAGLAELISARLTRLKAGDAARLRERLQRN